MSSFSQFEKQFKITGPDGTTLYVGGGVMGVVVDCQNAATTAGTADTPVTGEYANYIYPGEAVKINSGTVLGAWKGTSCPYTEVIKVNRVAAATDVALIGVALDKARHGENLPVAGMGSIVMARCTSGAAAVGALLTGSATVGRLAADATPLVGEVLGMVIKANAQFISTDADSYFAGVLVGASPNKGETT